MDLENKPFLGGILIFVSALSFALMTFAIKAWGKDSLVPSYEYAFFRFLLGFLCVSTFFLIKKKKPSPKKKFWLFIRGASNGGAVILLFASLTLTTLTKANMLNMTYPVWVAILSPFLLKEKISRIQVFALFVGFIGIWLVLDPNISHIEKGDLVALLSGIVMGIAVASLRKVRMTEDAETTLFWLFGIGVLMTIPFFPLFVIPKGIGILALFFAPFFGVVGQISINAGMKYIKGFTGAIISTARLVIAGVLGVAFLGEDLKFSLFLGGIFIILSIVMAAKG